MGLDPKIAELLQKQKSHSFPLELASNGKLGYPKDIEVRPYTTDEEKYLYAMDKNNTDTIIDRVLDALICTEGVTALQLSESDRLAVLIFARKISYMEKQYSFRVACPSCGKSQRLDVPLDDLKMKMLEVDLTQPVTLDLPLTKLKVVVKYPVHGDHMAADKYTRNYNRSVEQQNKMGNSMEELDSRIVRMANTIQAIHMGKVSQTELTIADKLEFYRGLEGADAQMIRDWSDAYDHGYLMEASLACRFCQNEETVDLPIDLPFLFPAI